MFTGYESHPHIKYAAACVVPRDKLPRAGREYATNKARSRCKMWVFGVGNSLVVYKNVIYGFHAAEVLRGRAY